MLKKIFLAVLVVLVAHLSYKFFLYEHPVPEINHDAFWGPGQPGVPDDPAVIPFKIDVPESTLKVLKTRLDLDLRYQPSLEGTNFEYGFNPTTLKKVVDFWKNKYNWREREVKLNNMPQYVTQVAGLNIHFVHAKPEKVPAGMKVVPLLLLHGWPGSIKEFHSLIPMLTKPRDGVDFVFEVIAPSLPGYGFSQAAAKPGLSTDAIAVIFKKLMSRLGYEKFFLQGGDWGSIIATDLSTIYPESVLGLHVNMCGSMSQKATFYLLLSSVYPPLFMDKEIADALFPLSDFYSNLILEMGYMHLQATKPDTIGVALTNSPVGLAAYILEKHSTWTNPAYRSQKDGGLTEKYSMEDLLDNIMIYWLSGNVASSMRLYSEVFNKANMQKGWDDVPCKVPTVCARFPNELIIQPEFIIRLKYPNLLPTPARDHPDYEVHRPPRGGHFAAFEEPELLANSIFKGLNAIVKK